MPKVSIILPFYNAEAFLERSIASILEQSYTDFELLLVNNNSSDRSDEIVKCYQTSDNRLQILEEDRQGVVFASEKGFKNVTGTFITRTDADDVWHLNKLEKQVEYLKQNPECDVVSCRVNFKGSADNTGMQVFVDETNELLTHEQISLNRFAELQVINPTILFRRELVEKYGFYKEGSFPEDYELFLRWIEAGVQFHKLNERLFDWYDHENRLTRTDLRYSTEAFYKIKAEYLYRFLKSHNPFHPNVWIWGAGKLSKQRVRFLVQQGVNVETFIDVDPKKINTEQVISYKDIPEAGSCFIISYVNNRGMRKEIRNYLMSKEYIEGKHFIIA